MNIPVMNKSSHSELIDFLGMTIQVDNNGNIISCNELCLNYFSELEIEKSNLNDVFINTSGNEILEELFSKKKLIVTPVNDYSQRLLIQYFLIEESIIIAVKPAINHSELIHKNIELKKELEQFVYSISHDLTAPVRGISTLSHWIFDDLNKDLGEEHVKMLNLLKTKTDKLNDLIQSILTYSRIGRLNFNPVNIEVSKIVEPVIKAISKDYADVVFVNELKPVNIKIDQRLGHQLFDNILRNSVEHNSNNNLKIQLRSTVDEDHCKIIIEDNGEGISEKSLPKVFNMFYKNTAVDKLGVGLTIVKKIVEVTDGKIEIESIKNKGSTVYISLPVNT